MRALIVSNMLPDAAHPERGQFVRDQLAALRRLDGLDVELCELPLGARALARGAIDLRRRHTGERYDVVHAHFGLAAWPALAVPARVRALTVHGSDVEHPRTRLLTGAVLGRMDIIGAVSQPLIARLPLARARARAQVLPCGVDTERFRPIPRAQARARLGLQLHDGAAAQPEPFLLFGADPARPEKRHDRALALARAAGLELRTLGGVNPADMPFWVNAASAVLVPSEREGFGLAVLEALACDVPVLATPVGVHPDALRGVAGTLCAPFDLDAWGAALAPHLRAPDPRVAGRASAERYSAQRFAERVADAWRAALHYAG